MNGPNPYAGSYLAVYSVNDIQIDVAHVYSEQQINEMATELMVFH